MKIYVVYRQEYEDFWIVKAYQEKTDAEAEVRERNAEDYDFDWDYEEVTLS